MLKKFFAGIFLLMIFSAQASAMKLELYPQPIGKIFFDGKTFQIDGATKINGNSQKGVALFGDKLYPRTEADKKKYGTSGGDEFYGRKFYFHFDAAKKISSFGDKSKKNSVEVDTYGKTEIYRIANTAGSDLFLLKKISDDRDAIKVIGLRGGKWIILLNALDFREKFNIGENFQLSKIFTEENQIIFRYTLQNHFVDVICRWHAVNQKFYTEATEQ